MASWRLWARFWTPQASILEGLGSIFRGFGRLKRCLKGFPWWQPLCHRQASRSRPRSVRDLAEPPGRLPRMPVLPCPGSDGRGAHGVGGRWCPPPGGFQWNWSQVEHFGLQAVFPLLFFDSHKLNVLKNSVLEGPGLDFGSPGPQFWKVRVSIFGPPASFFNVCGVFN